MMAIEKVDKGVKHLTEPINEWVLVRNRIRLWVVRNAYTMLFIAAFGWMSFLTVAVWYNG